MLLQCNYNSYRGAGLISTFYRNGMKVKTKGRPAEMGHAPSGGCPVGLQRNTLQTVASYLAERYYVYLFLG